MQKNKISKENLIAKEQISKENLIAKEQVSKENLIAKEQVSKENLIAKENPKSNPKPIRTRQDFLIRKDLLDTNLF